MWKRVLCLLLTVTLLFSLSACVATEDLWGGALFLFLCAASDDHAEKEDIVAFVEAHQDELLTCIQTQDYSALEKYAIIKSIDAENDAVEFYCGGAGMGANTFYCGFFYTIHNDMHAVWGASDKALTPCGKGFAWQEEHGDNRYYTEKICENFYYYEASF